MKLTLLGTGTPRPSAERQATANLLETKNAHILFDAGRCVATQLAKVAKHPRDIDYVFITHHHFDHIAGLDDLLLAAWNDGRTDPIRIFGPDGTSKIINLFWQIYARDIAFRLKEAKVLPAYALPDIRELVVVQDIVAGEKIEIGDCTVTAHQVEHGHSLGFSHTDWPCFGFRIETGDKVLAISGDTIDCHGVRALAQIADLLLQCCYMAEAEITTPDEKFLSDLVIASATQAGQIAKAAQVKKMVLTHLSPKNDAMLNAVLTEAQNGHGTDVMLGADLMVFEV